MANGMLGGFDPQEIQQMMAQFGATEKERNDANKQALFALGFGLLGGRKGSEFQTISRAGLGALDYRNRTLADIPQQKAQQFNAASQMLSLQDKLRQRQEQRELSDILRKMPPSGAQAPSPMAQMPSLAPTNANAAQLATLQAAQPQQQAAANDPFAIYMAQANYLDSTGHPAARAEAAKLRDQALKWREKYAEPKVVMKGGKPVYERFGEYGGQREVPGAEVPPDFMTVARGGTTDVLNKYNLPATGQSFAHTPTFGEQTGQGQLNLARQRFAYDQTKDAAGQGAQIQTRAGELRKEFNALPQVKAFGEVQPVLQSAREALGQDTAAADLNLIYAAAKIFDPTSVVRESETSLVMGTGSPAERFKGQWNHVIGGGRLTPETRKNLMQQVESRGRGFESGYKQARMAYEGVAKKQGIASEDVFIEPIPQAPAKAETKDRPLTAAEQAELAALKKKHGR